MSKIIALHGREILDSRGNPTVEVDIHIQNAEGKISFGRAAVPSGASTGAYEAIELRDADHRYHGKGVQKAIGYINNELTSLLLNKEFGPQKALDEFLIHSDGTDNKSKFGANSLLGISMAYAKAKADEKGQKLYEYFGAEIGNTTFTLPVPMMNILNGGKHADSTVDIQEFMVLPVGAKNFFEAIRMGTEIFQSLKKILHDRNLATSVGDEGGFAPNLAKNEDALIIIQEAIKEAGYIAGKDVYLGLDVAATELFDTDTGLYHFHGEGKTFTSEQLVVYYQNLCKKYPILSIEDPLAEDDWVGWEMITRSLGDHVQIVGDDLFVTNTKRLKMGIEQKSANSILIKLNQIGTVTETIQAVQLAHKHHMTAVISHRSGETEDTTISDLVVGLATGQIKTGSLCRTDRVAKYNQLLRIAEDLPQNAYAGFQAFKHSR